MALPDTSETWRGEVNTVELGAPADKGGTRTGAVTVGGAKSMMYAGAPEARGRKPVVAVDVLDAPPADWPETLSAPYADVLDDPAAWAKKAVECGADLVCLKLDGTHPDKGDRSPEQAADAARAVRDAVGVPLILWGSGDDEKDNAVMPKVSEAVKGENALLGVARQENYRTIAAVCLADGHNLICQAPIDINIAKQVNILVSDLDFPLERVVMFQTTGALGYGLEYCYSIQERERLAALGGDTMMAMPVICDAGFESWRAKEAKGDDAEFPTWGPREERGPVWEATTAGVLLQSGVDIIRMRHPKAVAAVKRLIDKVYPE
jgi:acetyl-CoA decarbonylase/synthase complex subunit delta